MAVLVGTKPVMLAAVALLLLSSVRTQNGYIGLGKAIEAQASSSKDVCDIECGLGHKCFVHKQKDESGGVLFKGLCVALDHSARESLATDNDHLRLKVECPPMKDIGIGKDLLQCGEYRGRQCQYDLECNSYQICCSDGCWKSCVAPVLSRYP